MNIPAHVLAQANPLARRTIAQMQARSSDGQGSPSAAVQRAPQMQHQPPAERRLRVDLVADARRRQAEATERGKASMQRELDRQGIKLPKSDPSLRVDIVANMRARHGMTQPEATAAAKANMARILRNG